MKAFINKFPNVVSVYVFQILTSVKKEHITALPMLNVPTPMDLSTVKVISNTSYL